MNNGNGTSTLIVPGGIPQTIATPRWPGGHDVRTARSTASASARPVGPARITAPRLSPPSFIVRALIA